MARVTKIMLDIKVANINRKTGKNYKLEYSNGSVRLCRVCEQGGLETISPSVNKREINDILDTLYKFLHV